MATGQINLNTTASSVQREEGVFDAYSKLTLVQESIFKLRVILAGGVYVRDGLACIVDKEPAGADGQWTYTLLTTANLAAWTANQMLSGSVDEVIKYLVTSIDNSISGKASLVGFDPFRNVAVLTVTVDEDLPVFGVASELPEHMAPISFPVISGTRSELGYGNLNNAEYYASGWYGAGLDLDVKPSSKQRGLPVLNDQGAIWGLFTGDTNDGDYIVRSDRILVAMDTISSGSAQYGDWGLGVEAMGPASRQFFLPTNMRGSGLWVNNVYSEGPAYQAGIRQGDIILNVDGKTDLANVTTHDEIMEFYAAMIDSQPGSRHSISVYRPSTGELLNPVPQLEVGALVIEDTQVYDTLMGFEVCDLNVLLRRQWYLSHELQGILVSESSLWPSLPRNVVITEINGQPVDSVQKFREIFEAIAGGDSFTLEYTTMARNYEGCYQCAGLGAHQKVVLTK